MGQARRDSTDARRLARSASISATELSSVVQSAERFASAIEARAIALMLKLELTMPQLRTVMLIRRHGRANGRQLAVALGLTPAAVVGIGDQLEERGYLRRTIDANDRRITWFELTDEGTVALKSSRAVAGARVSMKAFLASLTPSEGEAFIKIADAFAEALMSALQADIAEQLPPVAGRHETRTPISAGAVRSEIHSQIRRRSSRS